MAITPVFEDRGQGLSLTSRPPRVRFISDDELSSLGFNESQSAPTSPRRVRMLSDDELSQIPDILKEDISPQGQFSKRFENIAGTKDTFTDIGVGLASAVTDVIPDYAARFIRKDGPSKSPTKLDLFIEEQASDMERKRLPKDQAEQKTIFGVSRGALREGTAQAAYSLPSMGTSLAGGYVGSFFGPGGTVVGASVGGSVGMIPMYRMKYDSVMEEELNKVWANEPGLSKEEALKKYPNIEVAAHLKGLNEVVPEMASGAISGGLSSKLAIKIAARVGVPQVALKYATSQPVDTIMEIGEETFTEKMDSRVDYMLGLSNERELTWGEAMGQVWEHTLVSTLVTFGLSTGAQTVRQKVTYPSHRSGSVGNMREAGVPEKIIKDFESARNWDEWAKASEKHGIAIVDFARQKGMTEMRDLVGELKRMGVQAELKVKDEDDISPEDFAKMKVDAVEAVRDAGGPDEVIKTFESAKTRSELIKMMTEYQVQTWTDRGVPLDIAQQMAEAQRRGDAATFDKLVDGFNARKKQDIQHDYFGVRLKAPDEVVNAIMNAKKPEDAAQAIRDWRTSDLTAQGVPDDIAAKMVEAEINIFVNDKQDEGRKAWDELVNELNQRLGGKSDESNQANSQPSPTGETPATGGTGQAGSEGIPADGGNNAQESGATGAPQPAEGSSGGTLEQSPGTAGVGKPPSSTRQSEYVFEPDGFVTNRERREIGSKVEDKVIDLMRNPATQAEGEKLNQRLSRLMKSYKELRDEVADLKFRGKNTEAIVANEELLEVQDQLLELAGMPKRFEKKQEPITQAERTRLEEESKARKQFDEDLKANRAIRNENLSNDQKASLKKAGYNQAGSYFLPPIRIRKADQPTNEKGGEQGEVQQDAQGKNAQGQDAQGQNAQGPRKGQDAQVGQNVPLQSGVNPSAQGEPNPNAPLNATEKRQQVENKAAFENAKKWGYTELTTDSSGWARFELERESIQAPPTKKGYVSSNSIELGKSPNGKWTFSQSVMLSESGSAGPLNISGPMFNSREEALRAAITSFRDTIPRHMKPGSSANKSEKKILDKWLDELEATLPKQDAASASPTQNKKIDPKQVKAKKSSSEPIPAPETAAVDTIAGRISLTEFESKGYTPDQVTKADWINLQRAERRRLGQKEGGDNKNAPWAEYEEFHRQAVESAVKNGEQVDPEVLKDYPDLGAPANKTVPEKGTETQPVPDESLDVSADTKAMDDKADQFIARIEKEFITKKIELTRVWEDLDPQDQDDIHVSLVERGMKMPSVVREHKISGRKLNIRATARPIKPMDPAKAAEISTSKDSTRNVLQGIFFDAKEQAIVSTDGRRLFTMPFEVKGESVVRATRDMKEEKIRAGEPMDGQFPNWKQVMPGQGNLRRLKVDAMRAYNNARVAGNALPVITSTDILVNFKAGKDTVYMNPAFFADAVQQLLATGATEVSILVADPEAAILFEGDNGAKAVVMPVRTDAGEVATSVDMSQLVVADGGSVQAPAPAPAPKTSKPAKTKKIEPKKVKPKVKSPIDNLSAEDQAELKRLEDEMRDIMGRLNMGIDPDILVVGTKMASIYVKGGVKTFGQFAAIVKDRMADNWDRIKRYLHGIWTTAGADNQGLDEPTRAEAEKIIAELDAQDADAQDTDTTDDAGEAVDTELRTIIEEDTPPMSKSMKMQALAKKRGIDIKALQELAEVEIVKMADEIVRTTEPGRPTYDKLLALYNKQPNLYARTSTSVAEQAYSTPAPISYAGGYMIDLINAASVYEPTAGNAMLVIGVDKDKVTVNELNDRRAGALRDMGYQGVTQNDATGFVPTKKHAAVIANPPFGAIKSGDRGYNGYAITKIDHMIALKSLETLPADGRAVLILGAKREEGDAIVGADRTFMNYLYNNFNVAANFEVDGELYKKQGAAWPIRVIVLDGRRDDVPAVPENLAPNSVERLNDWDKIWSRAEEIRNDLERKRADLGSRNELRDPTARGTAAQDDGGVPSEAGGNNRPVGGRRGGAERSGGRAQPSRQPSGERIDRPSERGTADDVQGTNEPAGNDQVGGRGLASERVAQGSQGNARQSGQAVDGRTGSEGVRDRSGSSNVSGAVSLLGQKVTAGQSEYIPASTATPLGTLIPSNMAQGVASALEKIRADHNGDIDSWVADELGYSSVAEMHKGLAAEQVDGIAMAITQVNARGAFIIGDETGIGKGRQAAALISWAKLQGFTPVFITKDAKLFSDMNGDLQDINRDWKPFIMGDPVAAKIVDKDGNVIHPAPSTDKRKKIMSRIISDGIQPSGYDSIVLTYAQIKTQNEQQSFLTKLADKEKVIFILDEAHEGSGEASTVGAFLRGGKIDKGSGGNKKVITYNGVLNKNGNQGTVYLSATWAKRPENIPLYLKTKLGLAADNVEQLVESMSRGGVAMQQAVAEALAKSGQMIRRERDFSGVKFERKAVGVEQEADLVQRVDEVTAMLREIRQFSSMVVEAVEGGVVNLPQSVVDAVSTNQTDNQINVTDFASIAHNYISQVLLALKVESVANEAVESFKRGEKPVIALMNTLETVTDDIAEQRGFKPGDKVSLNYRDILRRAVDRTMRVSYKDAAGKPQVYQFTAADAGLTEMYDALMAEIDEMDINLPISPIDAILFKLREAGIKVGELTGRTSGIKYGDDMMLEGVYESRQKANKNEIVNGFNAGRLDAIILNASGSTGLSIHASPAFSERPIKPRTMIIAQAHLDIAVVLQTLGRIKRTGMIEGGASYIMPSLPLEAERRPAMKLEQKMKSLNANTTGAAESSVSLDLVDFFNKYGDLVVSQYLAEHDTQLAMALGYTVETNSKGEPTVGSNTDIAMKVTGKLALMPNMIQKRFYEVVPDLYQEFIENLKATDQYDLEMSVYDTWDGIQKTDQVMKAGTDEGSIFTASTKLEKWDIKDTRKVPTGDEMEKEFLRKHESAELFQTTIKTWFNTTNDILKKRVESYEAQLREVIEKEGAESPKAKQLEKLVKLASDHQKTFIDRTKPQITNVYQQAGQFVEVFDKDAKTSYSGMVVDVKLPTNTEGASTVKSSPGTITVTIETNRPGGRLRLRLSEFASGRYSMSRSDATREQMNRSKGDSRYDRYIITGNPIRAMAAAKSGRMVAFTARDGKVITGVLMPQTWEPSSMAEDPRVELAGGKAVQAWLLDFPARPVKSGVAEIKEDRTGYRYGSYDGLQVIVPRGARAIYLSPSVLKATGTDFISVGSKMVAKIKPDKVPAVSDAITKLTGISWKPEIKPTEKNISIIQAINAGKPLPSRNFDFSMLDDAEGTGVQNEYGQEATQEARASGNEDGRTQRGRGLSEDGAGWEGRLAGVKSGRGLQASGVSAAALEGIEVDYELGQSPEFTRISRRAKALGLSIVPVKGGTSSGFAHDGVIYVSRGGFISTEQIGNHELFHILRETALASRLMDMVNRDSAAFKTYKTRLIELHRNSLRRYGYDFIEADRLAKQYVTDAVVAEEMAADFFAGINTKYSVNIADAFANDAASVRETMSATLEQLSAAGDPNLFRANMGGQTAPVFFSKLRRLVEGKMPNRATVQAVRNMVDPAKGSGVKSEELEWTGLNDFLDGKRPTDMVTREDVMAAIQDVTVTEVVYRSTSTMEGARAAFANNTDDEIRDTLVNQFYLDPEEVADMSREQLLEAAVNANDPMSDSDNDETRYKRYTLPGGKNYREMLLTLPKGFQEAPRDRDALAVIDAFGKSDEAAAAALKKYDMSYGDALARRLNLDAPEVFYGAHWGEPNILASVRFNERISDSNGFVVRNIVSGNRSQVFETRKEAENYQRSLPSTLKTEIAEAIRPRRTLFIEEAQSDWHQEGRKSGYKSKGLPAGYRVVEAEDGYEIYAPSQEIDGGMLIAVGEVTEAQAINLAREHADRQRGITISVLDAPFKTTWPILTMKRMIRWAAENGFDQIAWTTGQQQVDRYKLSKQVSRLSLVEYSMSKRKTLYAYNLDGNQVLKKEIRSNSEIEKYIGKEAAKRIVEADVVEQPNGAKEQALSGLDLDITDKGMEGFYDQILPAEVNKYVKKWGGRVSTSRIPLGEEGLYILDAENIELDPDANQEVFVRDRNSLEAVVEPFNSIREAEAWLEANEPNEATVHSLDITPAMRESVMTEGQTLFSMNDPMFSMDDAQQGPTPDVAELVQRLQEQARMRDRAIGATQAIEGRAVKLKERERAAKLLERAKLKESTANKFQKDFARLAARRLPLSMRGRALSLLRRVKTQKQFDRAAERIEQIAEKYEKQIAIRALKKFVKRLDPNKMRPEYRDAVMDILGWVDMSKMTPANRRKYEQMAEHLASRVDPATNPDAMLPERAVQAIRRLGRTPISELPASEINEIHAALKHYAQLNALKNKLLTIQRWRGIAKTVRAVVNEIRTSADKLPVKYTAMGRMKRMVGIMPSAKDEWPAKRGVMERVRRDWFLRPENLMREMSDTLGELIWEGVGVQAYSKQLGILQVEMDALNTALNQHGMKIHTSQLDRWRNEIVEVAGISMSRGENIELYGHMLDPNTRKEIAKSGITIQRTGRANLKLTPAQIDQVMEETPDVERSLAEAMRERYNGEQRKQLNKAWVKTHGYEVARNEGYYPRIRDLTYTSTGVAEDGQILRDMGVKTLESLGILKDRTGSSAPVVVRDAFETFIAHSDQTSRVIAYTPVLRDIKAILGNRWIKRSIIERYGRDRLKMLEDRINEQAVGTMDKSEVDMAGRRILTPSGMSILSMRPFTALLNPAGLPITASYVDDGFKHLAASMAAPLSWSKISDEARKWSPYWRERYENYIYQVTTGVAGYSHMSIGPKPLMQYGLSHIEFTDKIGAMIRWDMAKRQIEAENPDIETNSEAYWTLVARQWERNMFRGENTAHPMEHSKALAAGRRNPWFGQFAIFSSSTTKSYSAGMDGPSDMALADRIEKSGDSEKAASLRRRGTRKLIGFAFSVAFVSMIRELRRSATGDDEDDYRGKGERFTITAIKEAVSMIPVFGSTLWGLVGTIEKRMMGDKSTFMRSIGATPATTVIDDGAKFIQSIIGSAFAQMEGDIEKRNKELVRSAEGLASFVAMFKGLPYSGLNDWKLMYQNYIAPTDEMLMQRMIREQVEALGDNPTNYDIRGSVTRAFYTAQERDMIPVYDNKGQFLTVDQRMARFRQSYLGRIDNKYGKTRIEEYKKWDRQ